MVYYTVSETRRFESLSGLFEKKKQTNKSKSTHASMWQEINAKSLLPRQCSVLPSSVKEVF